MSKISLYQAVIDKQNAIMLCMDEDGVLDMDKFDLIEGSFTDRALANIAVHKSMATTVVGLKAQRAAVYAEYTREIERVESNAQRIKEKLHQAMKTTGVMSMVSMDGMLSAKLLLEQDESVELDEHQQFPRELCNIPAPTPSKTLIKARILAGEAVAGARLVRKDRLTIK